MVVEQQVNARHGNILNPVFFNGEYSISNINICLISQQIKYDYIICIEQNCKKKLKPTFITYIVFVLLLDKQILKKAKNLIFKIKRIILLMRNEND